jgi:hypothetical protein
MINYCDKCGQVVPNNETDHICPICFKHFTCEPTMLWQRTSEGWIKVFVCPTCSVKEVEAKRLHTEQHSWEVFWRYMQ